MTPHQRDFTSRDVAERLAATLDVTLGPVLPALWHWAFFPDAVPARLLGRDGHRAADQLIKIDPGLPARMWAGGRVMFHRALGLDAELARESRVMEIKDREGRSGRLRFVKLHHSIFAGDELAIEEEQDLVYRAPDAPRATAGIAPPAPPRAHLRTITPDEILLFRFSAITFNAHRIHYDRPYATSVERYPGLVVHGPLQAILLAGHLAAACPGAVIRHFAYRGQNPAFVNQDLHLEAWHDEDDPRIWHLQTRDPEGAICMSAQATLHPDSSCTKKTA